MNDEAADPLTRTVSLSGSATLPEPALAVALSVPAQGCSTVPLGIRTASVVINTYNRAAYLKNAIQSILCQSYAAIELVVVNGPSTDDTERLLEELKNAGVPLKTARCPSRNLSESRNIGISQAAGDVVFFIDDDAVAHPDWVARLIAFYSDPDVGGAGGFTIDHTGVNFQCRYTVCDRNGNAQFLNFIDATPILEKLGGFHFPSLLGTNCSFRRSDLLAINGFDPAYAYFLDETDVCLRLFNRKRRILTVPSALVFHKYAPSEIRSVDKIPSSLLASATSKAHFVTKHAAERGGASSALVGHAELEHYTRELQFSNRWYLDHKRISAEHYLRLDTELQQGIAAGMRSGLEALRQRDAPARGAKELDAGSAFLSAISESRAGEIRDRLRIYFVSQGYPPRDTSGIARWTHECAKSLSARGHEVHVLTRSTTAHHYVDYVDGIWVHALVDEYPDKVLLSPVDVPDSLARRAAAVYAEIMRADAIWGVDVVSAPIWDLEGLFCVRYLRKPVITSLHTTYLLALPTKSDWLEREDYRRNHVEKVIRGERWLLRESRHILANSQEVLRAIDEAYGLQLASGSERVQVIPHGIEDGPNRRSRVVAAELAEESSDEVSVLFVGRIESRKGVDQLLSALLRLRPGAVKLRVRVVGSWPSETDSYALRIKGLARQVGTKRKDIKLEFTGYASEKDLRECYESADIFVAPSRFESFGLIVVEAMRSACPVISTNIGGIREIVDSETGFLVDVDDVDSLAKRLENLIADRALRRKLGEGGRRKFELQFTAEKMAADLEGYFRSRVKSEVDNDRG